MKSGSISSKGDGTTTTGSSIISVKTAGIGTTQLASGAVASSNLASTILQVGTAVGTTDINTNSTSYIDVDSMSVSLTTAASKVLVLVSMSVYNNTGNSGITLGLKIDAAAEVAISYQQPATSITNDVDIIATTYLTTLTAAAHTITLRWKVSAGTVYNQASGWATPRRLTVIELRT